MSSVPGLVCWVDVSTADPAGSRDFYAGLFGWTYQIDPDPGSGHYTTAVCGGGPVAGLAGVAVQPGQPLTWTVYLASADIMYTAEVFIQGGGQVLYGPADVPGRGRVLVGADPTDAVIGFWQPTPPWIFHTGDPGSLIWAELNTWNGPLADEFFASLFGYDQKQIGDRIQVDYTTWSRGGRTMLGRMQMYQDWAADLPAHWMPYFAVDPEIGTDAAVNRVLELGGQVNIYPYNTEFGRIARVTDPFGASFALVDPTKAQIVWKPPSNIAEEAAIVEEVD
ncbi:MAG: VOC family protein [Actinomycetota bacterium]|nr:VOC family protein [Actinomycetota bacterium]